MILRKLADAIREQKWFTVFIELLIVIFGVYIGLYLSGEQQAIDHRKETMQALAALEAEFRSDLARVDEIIEFQKQRQAQYKQAMDLLTNASRSS